MKEFDFDSLRRDPVEQTEIYQAVNPVASCRAFANTVEFACRWAEFGLEQQMSHWIDTMYNCDRFCFEKKQILMKTYGIDWKTPFELNPELYAVLGKEA